MAHLLLLYELMIITWRWLCLTLSTVWEHEEWEKHLIIKEICEHVLMRHLALPKQSIICTVDQLDFVLRHSNRGKVLEFFFFFELLFFFYLRSLVIKWYYGVYVFRSYILFEKFVEGIWRPVKAFATSWWHSSEDIQCATPGFRFLLLSLFWIFKK